MGGILIPRAFLAALGQIRDPRFRTVLANGLLLTVLLLSALHYAILYILPWILPETVALSVVRDFGPVGSLI